MTHGLQPIFVLIKESYIILHEADQPDLVSDFPDTHVLAGEYGAEVDFSSSDTDTAALGDFDGAVVERVLRDIWVVKLPG